MVTRGKDFIDQENKVDSKLDPNLGLNASGRESEEGEGGGRPVALLVRISLP